ncbi:MAG TPA: trimethylamine methyltransferase family protein [Anaerovoracaceae bacterium]|nr:trimethylamine methyltransferase family protein [Anaerovoracaceae bacterium]
MKKRNIEIDIEFNILTKKKKDKVHEFSLKLLEEVGIEVTGEKMLELLKNNGAEIGNDNIVKIPRKMVEKAMKSVPKEVILYNRDGDPIINIGEENNIYFGSIAEQLEYLDYKTNKSRRFMREDMKTMCVLQDYLPNISFTTSVGLIDGVPSSVAGQIGFIETLRNFSKSIHVVTSDVDALKDIVNISKDFVGGKEKLMEKPLFMYYAEPIPPFKHPYESNERLMVCAENGIPVVYMPYSMMGGTAPVTLAAALAQNNAEILAGMVMTQLVREGAPYIYGSMPTVFDMKSTIGSYGAPEFHLAVAASSEMADYYGIPFYGTASVSDARTIDMQSISEIEMTLFSSILSKANLVHDIGLLEHARNISPVAIYISNEIIDQLKNYTKGIEINDDMFLFDTFKNIGPGGHYLNDESTLKNFKKMWYPKVFTRNSINPEESDLMDRVIEKIDYILKNHKVKPLEKEKEDILKKYEKELLDR